MFEVYENMIGGGFTVYATCKYIEHANYLCEYLNTLYGSDSIHVRNA